MAPAPDDAIDRLYGLPLDAFVTERDALAKALRGDGKRDEAAAVKKLAKPTVAAWAVNQALRTQKKAARELWQAGDALAAAQDAILAGKGSGADLRAAAERERAAVEPLVDAARGLLTASGGDLSDATIERVRQTLHAGAIDPEAREEVASGRATRERAPQGLFGGGEVAPAPAPRARKAEPEPKPAPAPARKPAPKRDAAAAKREREAAKREREAAARERKEAAARERARKAAEQRVAKAEKAVAAAAERVEAARRDERAAVEALAEAKAELRALR